MNPIKVYLQYPWKFPDSPYYKYLIKNPPEGIEYFNIEKQRGVITNKKFFWISNFLKKNIRKFANFFKFSIPNAHLSPEGDYDLIHCAHCLSKNSKPWVADFEGVWQMYVGEKTKRAKEEVRRILENPNCRKILPWTEWTRREIIKEFPEIGDKVEVVYPAIPLRWRKKKENNINLIFSGRYFYWKGGLHALEAIDRLTKKYSNVWGIINSEVPEKAKIKYLDNKKIIFYGLIPQEELFELYKKSHILIYPGYSDSFGFAYLEAMSFGIPIITVDGFAREEIVENGKTGFVIEKPEIEKFNKFIKLPNPEIEKELAEKTSKLIENGKLRNKMSRNCVEIIKNGKFSVAERNSKLKKFYEEALK